MRPEDWQKRGMLSHFTVMRKLEGSIFPIGLAKGASDRNEQAGSNVLALESRWVQPFLVYVLYVLLLWPQKSCHLGPDLVKS